MKRIIFLIISFAFIASFETEAQIASTNKVFDWHPEAGENGIEAKIRFKCKYDSYFQEPTVIKTAKATKGNTIYYEGETYTKDKIGERAWNQIDITDISVSFDIYDGRRHICTITYDNLVSYDVAGSPEWGETLQSCLDAESEKELFKKGFSIRNVRLVNAKAIGMGGVAKYVRKKKRDEKYKRIIAEADSYFSSSSYQSAIEKYKEASNVKPEEEYPEDKIDQIQSLLEEKKIDSYYANEEMENEEMGNEEKNKNSDEKYDYQKNSDVNYTSTKNQGYEQYKYLSNELNEIEEYGEKLEQTLTNNAILLANAIEALSSNNRASQRSKWKRIYYNRDIAKEKSRESRINIGKNEYLGFINGKSYGHVYLWDGLKDCSFINELPYAPTTSSLKYFKAKKELGGAIKKPNYYLKIKNRKKIELYYNYFPKNDLLLSQTTLNSKLDKLYKKLKYPINCEYNNNSVYYTSYNYELDRINKSTDSYSINIQPTGWYTKEGLNAYDPQGFYVVYNKVNNKVKFFAPFSYSPKTKKAIKAVRTKDKDKVSFYFYNSFSDLWNDMGYYLTSYKQDFLEKKTTATRLWHKRGERACFWDIIKLDQKGDFFIYASVEAHSKIKGGCEYLKTYNQIINIHAFNNGIKICELPIPLLRLVDVYFNKNNNIVVVGIDRFECLIKKEYNTEELIKYALYKENIKRINLIPIEEFIENGDYKLAIKKLENEKELSKDYIWYYVKLKIFVYQHFDLDKANKTIETFQDNYPELNNYTNIELTRNYYHMGKFQKALKYLKKIEPNTLNKALYHFKFALIYQGIGNQEKAKDNFAKVVKHYDKSTKLEYAFSLYHLGQTAKAEKIFDDIIKSKKSKAELKHLYYGLAQLYAKVDKSVLALNYLEKSIKNGFRNHYWIINDTELKKIQKTDRFKNLLENLNKELTN